MTAWKSPFVFQGSFKIASKHNNTIKLLYFRCECYLNHKTDIQNDFHPDDYKFTHLYSAQSLIILDEGNEKIAKALYLLKYALKITLEQLLIRSSQYFTYVDEIASASMSEKMKNYIEMHSDTQVDGNIGFAVSIDFDPSEKEGQDAVLTLLNIDAYLGSNDSLH